MKPGRKKRSAQTGFSKNPVKVAHSTPLEEYRANPAQFIADTLIDPETGKPFQLLPAEVVFLDHAFRTDANGRLIYPEQVFSAPKKSGKTGFAALFTLTMCLIFGGQYAEPSCRTEVLRLDTPQRLGSAMRRASSRLSSLGQCPLYPQKRTLTESVGMSALCQ